MKSTRPAGAELPFARPAVETSVVSPLDSPKELVREVVDVAGQPVNWYYLRLPASVIVVPITSTGAVVMVRQFRRNLRRHTLELPAGVVTFGDDRQALEEAHQAAARELREETGFELPGGAFEALGRYYVLPSETDKHAHVFLARPVVRRGPPRRDREIEKHFDMSVVEIAFDDALGRIGREIDGIETVAALLLAHKRLLAAP